MPHVRTALGTTSQASPLQLQYIYPDSEVRTILGVELLVATADRAIALLDERVTKNQGTIVAFANAHTLNVAAKTSGFRDALNSFIVLNDGVGTDIASRLLYGRRFPENLNGTDFTPRYLRETKCRFSIFLLGAKPGVAERAAVRLADQCPQHRIVGFHHGYVYQQDDQVVTMIRDSGADLLLVAMGNPQQELWLRDNFAATGCQLGIAVGALLDFIAGEVPRANERVRAMRLEWAYRLACEPRRLWFRYIVGNPVFLMRVAAQWALAARVGF